MVSLLAIGPCSAGAEQRPLTYTPPKTLEVKEGSQAATIHRAPAGEVRERWPGGTLLTSDRRRGAWVRVTGHFPEGRWRPMGESAWIPRERVRVARPVTPKVPVMESISARTYALKREALVRDGPRGRGVTRWPEGARFTVRRRLGEWLKVSGRFPNGEWQRVREPMWVAAAAARDISPPPDIPLPDGAKRYIVVDKSDFKLRVIEERDSELRIRYTTEVGLGMDDCLPEKHGGNCYYTRTGEYRVRWRIHEPDGIDWCIPESMAEEPEYARDLARGKRCFEGALGRFALNIGESYAIHGTRDLSSLGRKESHGCIRARPEAVRRVWRYMREGDRVLIQE